MINLEKMYIILITTDRYGYETVEAGQLGKDGLDFYDHSIYTEEQLTAEIARALNFWYRPEEGDTRNSLPGSWEIVEGDAATIACRIARSMAHNCVVALQNGNDRCYCGLH